MTEKRGLGKGLSALIPPREFAPGDSEKKEGIISLKVGQIRPNPFQPREDFDQENFDALIASIKEKGIIQPVLVRPYSQGGYELIAGERRLRAAKALKLEEIPAIVRDVNDEESLEIALIENIQRQELNPIEEARAFKYLIEKFGYTQDKIAQAVGKARVSVANILRLLKLPEELQNAIRQGSLTFAHGKVLLELDDSPRQLSFARQAMQKGLSVKGLEHLISSIGKIKKAKSGLPAANPLQIKKIEEQLQQALGTRVRIYLERRGGRINIEFYSDEDLERIYGILKGGQFSGKL